MRILHCLWIACIIIIIHLGIADISSSDSKRASSKGTAKKAGKIFDRQALNKRTLSLNISPLADPVALDRAISLEGWKTASPPTGHGFLPFDGRWLYNHWVSYRPGHLQQVTVNPPRFSWPYTRDIIPKNRDISTTVFQFQVSKDPEFQQRIVDEKTDINFYNALSPFPSGEWYWRVGYHINKSQLHWSGTRKFSVAPQTPTWDRSVINRAHEIITAKAHPRFGPGDWGRLKAELANTKSGGKSELEALISQAKAVTRQDWWEQFPKTDQLSKEEIKKLPRKQQLKFRDIAADLALVSFVYFLTEDKTFKKAKEHLLEFAEYQKGGMSSPEFHTIGFNIKFTTEVVTFLGVCYDWWFPHLSASERQKLIQAIEWRLHAVFFEAHSWLTGEQPDREGVAIRGSSHPYQNLMWCVPAVLATVGDGQVSDRVLFFLLNFMAGYGVSQGPDEGWNEGQDYAVQKGGTMLAASLYVDMVFPELQLARANPYYRRLGEWYAHLLRPGVTRMSFGDAYSEKGPIAGQIGISQYLAWLTGDGRFTQRQEVFQRYMARKWGQSSADGIDRMFWLPLLAKHHYRDPQSKPWTHMDALYPEAGWVMVANKTPDDLDGVDDLIGMIFQCRSRGGYSHSYWSENSFVWYAFGQTLSAGGASSYVASAVPKLTMSHNAVLIDGLGQEWNDEKPAYPYVGRLIAYREAESFVHWVGDATHAYQTLEGVKRVHRHVVFVNRKYFVIYDDVALDAAAKKARFSFLFHIPEPVEVTLQNAPYLGFEYRVGHANAKVVFANAPQSVKLVHQSGQEGYKNLITGEDFWKDEVWGFEGRRAKDKGSTYELGDEMSASVARLEKKMVHHSIWLTTQNPSLEGHFLVVLLAWKQGNKAPKVNILSERAIQIIDGSEYIVSFDPNVKGTIQIDPTVYQTYAQESDPYQKLSK